MGTTDWLGAGARIGDYVIEREITARPGFVAWSARHALLPRRARISTVHPAFAGATAITAQLTREACILEVLRHAGAPRVFECALLPDGRPWVACELIEGPKLSLILAEEGRLGVPMVLALLAGVAEILHYAHTRGLVHRNLRPDAIASRSEGPCIVDWSDARARDGEVLQLAPSDWLAYQPPEVVAGESADSRADVYSLGVIASEALAGAKPPAGARRTPAAPPRLVALLERMTAEDALVRPTSAEVRAEALAIVEQLEVPMGQPADEDSDAEVQIVDLELHAEGAADADGDLPAQLPDGSLSWAAPEVDDRARTRTMEPEAIDSRAPTRTMEPLPQPEPEPEPIDDRARTRTMPAAPQLDPSRTRTEPMVPEHVVSLSRTKTEPMPAEQEPRAPEPRLPRTSTRMGKLALPSRVLEPSGTKPP